MLILYTPHQILIERQTNIDECALLKVSRNCLKDGRFPDTAGSSRLLALESGLKHQARLSKNSSVHRKLDVTTVLRKICQLAAQMRLPN